MSFPFRGALVVRTADFTVSNDTFQIIDGWTMSPDGCFDEGGYFDVGDDDRFTIPSGQDGYYIVGGTGRWKATNNTDPGVRNIAVYGSPYVPSLPIDPATQQAMAELEWPNSELTGALMHMAVVSPPRPFVAGDFVQMSAYQYSDNAASLDLDANGDLTPAFWIMKVG